VTAVPVTVTISPQNTPPTVSYGKVKLLVTATYTATYNDAEGDAPTYTITTTPTKGTLISTRLGISAYASTSLGAPDSFAITVSDGHGGRSRRRSPSSTGRRASRLPSSGPWASAGNNRRAHVVHTECVDDGSRPAGRSEATRLQYRDRQGGTDDEA
jgi:hypothetical protein